jgi:hypothetical protein
LPVDELAAGRRRRRPERRTSARDVEAARELVRGEVIALFDESMFRSTRTLEAKMRRQVRKAVRDTLTPDFAPRRGPSK